MDFARTVLISDKPAEDASVCNSPAAIALQMFHEFSFVVDVVKLQLPLTIAPGGSTVKPTLGMKLADPIVRSYTFVYNLSSLGLYISQNLMKTIPQKSDVFGSLLTAVKLQSQQLADLDMLLHQADIIQTIESSTEFRLHLPFVSVTEWTKLFSSFNKHAIEQLTAHAIKFVRESNNACLGKEIVSQRSICFSDDMSIFDEGSAFIMAKDQLDTVVAVHNTLAKDRDALKRVETMLAPSPNTQIGKELEAIKKIATKTLRSCTVACAFAQGMELLARYRHSPSGIMYQSRKRLLV